MEGVLKSINCALCALPDRMDTPEARVMLIAIGLQESRFQHRRQLVGSPPRPVGPAKSFWQAEQGGGMVRGLLNYHSESVRNMAAGLCMVRGVSPDTKSAWDAIEDDDVLAAGLARLLLWTDPFSLPKLGDSDAAWDLYLRVWRPGRPHPGTWNAFYAQALDLVNGAH